MNNLNLDDFPGSAHAAELRAGLGRLRFESALEAEYTSAHLARVQLRVRIWSTMAAVATVLFAIGQGHRAGLHNAFSQIYWNGLFPCAVMLTGIAWSRWFMRWYLPTGQVLVLIFNVLAAVLIVQALVEGREEELAALPVNLMAAFFFSGLKFRQALLVCVSTILAFSIAALLLGLERTLFVKSIFGIAVTAITAAVVYWDVEQAYRRGYLEGALINELVAVDALTGLMNRRAFDAHLRRVWHQAQRENETLALIMIDIDFFKRYNDEHGHQAGDLALKSVGQAIKRFARRPLDLAARYGGEEFVLILWDLSLDHLESIAEQLRAQIELLHVAQPGIASAITASIGVGMAVPMEGRVPDGAIQLADEALYEAKSGGRNRVVVKGVNSYLMLVTGAFTSAARRRHSSDRTT